MRENKSHTLTVIAFRFYYTLVSAARCVAGITYYYRCDDDLSDVGLIMQPRLWKGCGAQTEPHVNIGTADSCQVLSCSSLPSMDLALCVDI